MVAAIVLLQNGEKVREETTAEPSGIARVSMNGTELTRRISEISEEREIARLADRYRASEGERVRELIEEHNAVRAERRRLDEELRAAAEAGDSAAENVDADLLDLRAARRTAIENSSIGVELPDFRHYPWYSRPLARVVARLVFFVSRNLTGPQRTFNEALLGVIDTSSRIADRRSSTRRLHLERERAVLEERGVRIELELTDLDFRLHEAELRLGRLRSVQAREAEATQRIEALEELVTRAETRGERERAGLADVEGRLDRLEDRALHRTTLDDEAEQRLIALRRDLDELIEHRRLAEQREATHERRHLQVVDMLQRMAVCPSKPTDGEREPAAGTLGDTLYADFEDRFRGSTDEIRDRLRPYLGSVRTAGAGASTAPVVDLGCGRGEWLRLLGEEGLQGSGVDVNRVLTRRLRAEGLDVEQGDALAFLRSLPERSVGAVTAFHLIEHLQPGYLVDLLDEVVRVLLPGGLLIVETPNPENLYVAALYFYTDPSHVRPVVSDYLEFLVAHRGLCEVEIRRLREHRPALVAALEPVDPAVPEHASINRVIELVNRHFCAPPDYALVARKAGDAAVEAADS